MEHRIAFGLVLGIGLLLASCRSRDFAEPGPPLASIHVVESDGEPAPHARVRVVLDPYRCVAARVPWRRLHETTGDGDGQVGIPICEGTTSVFVEVGSTWRFLEYGCGTGLEEWEGARIEVPQGGESYDRVISVLLTDRSGAVLCGASVSLVAGGEGGPVPWLAPLETDGGGRLLIRGMEYGAWFLDVVADGFAPRRICPAQLPPGESEPITIALEACEWVTGIVAAETRHAKSVAWIEVRRMGGDGFEDWWWQAEVDAEGRFRVAVPRGAALEWSLLSARGELVEAGATWNQRNGGKELLLE